MPGRPPTPTPILEARGAFRRNPSRGRARENEPRPTDPLGPPPQEWLDKAATQDRFRKLVQAWEEIVAQAAFGVLTSADRDCVEAACYLKHKIREAARGYGKTTAGDFAQLKTYLRSMGLTPEDRSRVSGTKKAAESASEWAKLAAARRPAAQGAVQ
jgi:hypothetical protein